VLDKPVVPSKHLNCFAPYGFGLFGYSICVQFFSKAQGAAYASSTIFFFSQLCMAFPQECMACKPDDITTFSKFGMQF